MLKKTIVFKDLDGNDITEDFYFGLTKAEIATLELSQKGGLSEYLKTIVAADDGASIMKTFQDIIGLSVGVRSDDGRRFIKNDEVRDNFMQTDAYSVLFMELVTDAERGSEFIRGIVPSDLAQKIESGERVTSLPLPSDEVPVWIKEDRDPTNAELQSMSKPELQLAFKRMAERHS